MDLGSRILGVAAALSITASGFAQTEADFAWRRVAHPIAAQGGPSAAPDGLFLIDNNTDCLLMRQSDGTVVRRFQAGARWDNQCLSAIASPDGRFVAVHSLLSYPQVLWTADWTTVLYLPTSGKVAFSPDARAMLFCSGAGSRIFDAETWTVRATIATACDASYPISISPNSELAAIAAYGLPSPRIIRMSDGADVTPPSGFQRFFGIHLLADEWIAFTGPQGVQIGTLTEPPELLATLPAPASRNAILSLDGRYLAVIFDNSSSIRVWETETFSPVATWPIPEEAVGGQFRGIAFALDGTSLIATIAGHNFAEIATWNVPEGTRRATLMQDDSITSELTFSPNGELAAAGFGSSGNIRIRRTSDGDLVQTLLAGASVKSVAFSPNGEFLISRGDSELDSWGVRDGSRLQSLYEPMQQPVHDIAISSAGLLAERTNVETRLRTIPELTLARTLPAEGPLSFSPDGGRLLVGNALFDVATGVEIRRFPIALPTLARYGADGQTVVLVCDLWHSRCPERLQGVLWVFDVDSGDLKGAFGKLIGYSGYYYPADIRSLAVSADGMLAQLSSADRHYQRPHVYLRLWDGSGNRLVNYELDMDEETSVSFSPDSRYIGWVGSDGVYGVMRNPCIGGACAPPYSLSKLYDNFMVGPSSEEPIDVNPGLWVEDIVSGHIDFGRSFEGDLPLVADAEPAHVAVVSRLAYSLLDSEAHVEVPEVVGNGDRSQTFSLRLDEQNRLEWVYANRTLHAIAVVDGIETRLASVPYTDQYLYYRWQIRESAGRVYWETAARASAVWTTHAAVATADLFSLESVRAVLALDSWTVGSPRQARTRYRNFNQ